MKKIKKNFIWNTVGITFNSFTSLFYLVIINRINNPSIGGIFSYTFSLACLFYIGALFYNRTYHVADIKSEFTNNQYISNRIISCIITIFFVFIFSIISDFNKEKTLLLIILMLYKALEAFADCFHGFIQKKEQLYYVGKSLFFKALFSVLLFILIDLFTKSIIFSSFIIVIVNAIGIVFDINKYKTLYNEKIEINFRNCFGLYKSALSLFIFSFLIIFINNCQKYVAGYILDDSLQNVLGIIIMPATMLTLCGQYLISPYLTSLTKFKNESKLLEFKKSMNNIIKIFIIIGLVILIVAYFLGIPVLNILYSIDLSNYKLSFIIIIIGAIFYSVSNIISNCLTVLKKNNEQLIIFFISSSLSVILSITLIKKYLIVGASYAYLITMFLHCLMSILLVNYIIKKQIRR